ncbi:MAG: helix-turn-helix transcriptional regulator [Clostridia bacterium]|nr:helix-turn-helix transcriptional regulator [Clostridia bacterium]
MTEKPKLMHRCFVEESLRKLVFDRQLVPADSERAYFRLTDCRIVRILDGRAVWQVNGRDYSVAAGDLLLLSSAKRRRIRSVETPEGLLFETVTFSLTSIDSRLASASVIFTGPDHIPAGSPAAAEGAVQFAAIAALAASPDAFAADEVRARITILLSAIARASESRSGGTMGAANCTLVIGAAAYLQEHYEEPLSEADVAAAVGITPSGLSALFREYMGIGYADYLRRLRLGETIARLREAKARGERMGVLDAALACGFGSSAGFYKAMRDVYGVSPKMLLGDISRDNP